MLLKGCTQYVSKFGKLSSGHRTEKGQFSFWSQRRAMRQNIQTTIWCLPTFLMLVRLCSKSFKLDFSSTWTENFQMFKLVLEKSEKQRIKLQHLLDRHKSKRIPEKHLLLLSDYAKAFDCVDHNKLKNSSRDGNTRLPYWSPEQIVCRSWNNSQNQTWNNGLVPSWERSTSRLYIVTLLI